eukprot:scaffold228865_cov27-Tisochrysis_lutea.AAC.2
MATNDLTDSTHTASAKAPRATAAVYAIRTSHQLVPLPVAAWHSTFRPPTLGQTQYKHTPAQALGARARLAYDMQCDPPTIATPLLQCPRLNPTYSMQQLCQHTQHCQISTAVWPASYHDYRRASPSSKLAFLGVLRRMACANISRKMMFRIRSHLHECDVLGLNV